MWRAGDVDTTTLAPAQVRALGAAAARELSWGLRAVSRELRGWRLLACAIPDARLREDALDALDHKRGHVDGAALFTILPRRREPALLRLLVAFQTIVDYLDNVSERHPTPEDGLRLHQALVDALDPVASPCDYYRHHPDGDDGGYLAALVEACRAGCRALPSFERVRPLLTREARRTLVLGLNHDPDSERRDAALRAWVERECLGGGELAWYEASGAASATLVVLVLLALAADPALSDARVAEVHAAYWPWVSLATTMLDSWVDQLDDATRGHHSYVAHYDDGNRAVRRTSAAVARGLAATRTLADGDRHAVIVSCMVAMYLSKPVARTPDLRAEARALARAGGALPELLVPVLRVWRAAYVQRIN